MCSDLKKNSKERIFAKVEKKKEKIFENLNGGSICRLSVKI